MSYSLLQSGAGAVTDQNLYCGSGMPEFRVDWNRNFEDAAALYINI